MRDPQYTEVDGLRTRYYAAGEGPTIVFVHGGHFGLRGSAEEWEPNFDALASDYSVIAYDKLGMGFSDNPRGEADYSIESHTRQLLGLLDVLGVQRAHLVGHSRGGYPVTRLAMDHPERVDTLTVVSSSSVTNPFNPVYAEWRAKAATMDEREGVRFLIEANSYSDAHITDRLVDIGVETMRLAKTQEAASLMGSGLYERFKTDLLGRVGQIKEDLLAGRLQVPTLLIWGFNDPSATIDRCAKPAIDQFFPSVERCEMHILNRAGHYCFREQPAAFNDVLMGFIERSPVEVIA